MIDVRTSLRPPDIGAGVRILQRHPNTHHKGLVLKI
jgi:hypothetical protein